MTALDHLERTFAEAYRKEIDQEDNVWRTLPFFAATLALEIGGLTQLRESILGVTGVASWLVGALGAGVGLSTLVAIVFLGRSISTADFTYIAGEPSILAYVAELEQAQNDRELTTELALEQLKRFLVRQYAGTTDNNRAINKRRASMRTIAGIATLVSVLATFALGGVTVVHQIGHGSHAGAMHAARSGEISPQPGAFEVAGTASGQGDSQRVVHLQGDDCDDRGGRTRQRGAPSEGTGALSRTDTAAARA